MEAGALVPMETSITLESKYVLRFKELRESV